MPTQTIKLTKKGSDPKGPGLLLTRQVPYQIVPARYPTPLPGQPDLYKTPVSGSAGLLAIQKLAVNRKTA